MTDDQKDEDPLTKHAAGFILLLIKAVKKHQELVTEIACANAALVQAVLERFPELASSYERYRQASEKDSPFARDSRLISAELDRLTAHMKTET
jgi:hypothetical protein